MRSAGADLSETLPHVRSVVFAPERACCHRKENAVSTLYAYRNNPLNHTGSNAEGAADLQDAHAIGFKLAYARLYGRLRRPSFVPFALARARPALTLSRMMPPSNSANTPSIWNIALPAVVDVSSPC